MPSEMRSQCPSDETPPSTRPPSVASSSTSMGTPHRSTSMDSIHTNSSTTEKPTGEQYIPTRMIKATPKANALAMQFVKTGPAILHKSAKEQMKKAEVVKSLRKTSLQEEEEWQTKPKVRNEKADDAADWQANLDKWKSGRRKMNEGILERVIEVKRNEQAEEYAKTRRKSKTFNEMREDKNRRGRKYNLVIHDDDNNDLSDLGLTSKKNRGSPVCEPSEEGEAKSDAGFCTGSDTGSDGVFPEDISDTSSALGDKREVHDSLLDSRVSPIQKPIHDSESNERIIYKTATNAQIDTHCCLDKVPKTIDENHNNSGTPPKREDPQDNSSINQERRFVQPPSGEYTYDKAIEDYKQFAENSAKKRLSASISTSNLESALSTSNSMIADDDILKMTSLASSTHKKRVLEKTTSVTSRFVEPRDFEGTKIHPRYLRKERLGLTKVDISKRRSMFELRDVGNDNGESTESSRLQKQRKSIEISDTLRNKVASFENIFSDSLSKSNHPNSFKNTNVKEKLTKSREVKKSSEHCLNDHLIQPLNKCTLDTERTVGNARNINSLLATQSNQNEKCQVEKNVYLNKCDSMSEVDVSIKTNAVSSAESPTAGSVFKKSSYKVSSTEKSANVTGSSAKDFQFPNVSESGASLPKNEALSVGDLSSVSSPNCHNVSFGQSLHSNSASTNNSNPSVDNSFFVPSPYIGVSKIDVPETDEDESLTREYGDQDIDEVIDDFDLSPGESPSGLGTWCADSSSRGQGNSENAPQTSFLNENCNVNNGTNNGPQDDSSTKLMGRSLQSASVDIEKLNLTNFEVVDISWSEDGDYCSHGPLSPPSEPPPPPPVEEEGDEMMPNTCVNGSINRSSPAPLSCGKYASGRLHENHDRLSEPSNPIKSTKEEMRKKMSAFLGTDPPIVPEYSIKPPPDVSEILRRERESERLIVQKQASLRHESQPVTSLSVDPFQNHRGKYTWEDRMKADGSKNAAEQKDNLDDSGDQFEFHSKLAELELEMEKHDREMMERIQGPAQASSPQKSVTQIRDSNPSYSDVSSVAATTSTVSFTSTSTNGPDMSNSQTNVISSFHTAPPYKKVEPLKSKNTTSQSLTTISSGKSKSYSNNSLNTNSEPQKSESISNSSSTTSTSISEEQPPPTAPRKKNIRALSALPKPKLNENESWITKRKAEAVKKDYNKHWLFQEAEQRRLEQQERIIRPSDASSLSRSAAQPSSFASSTRPVVFSSQNQDFSHSAINFKAEHYQNLKGFNVGNKIAQPSPVASQLHMNVGREIQTSSFSNSDSNLTHSPSLAENHNGNSSVVTFNNNNGNFRRSPQTYQPPVPNYPPSTGSNKPLPDAIIHTITQRVQNKNKINANYSSRIRTMDEHCDYANSEVFSPHSNSHYSSSPSSTAGGDASQERAPSPCQSQQGNNKDDQCLLSVSGKKKCSHCSEELGRGAAMIIESLRLFYHIPCFKCCVCGVQLGNGTSGADVRVRNHKLHCHNCYSNDEGMKFSKV